MKRLLLFSLFLLLAACGEEWDWSGVEAGNATLAGVLRNASGQPVPATAVFLYNKGSAAVLQSDTTDVSGRFRFTELTAGDYVIRATVAGNPVSLSAAIASGQTYVQVELAPSVTPAARSVPRP